MQLKKCVSLHLLRLVLTVCGKSMYVIVQCSKRVVMNDFFKLPVALTEALSKNDMMLVVGGDRAVKITVVNEGHGCNMVGALNRGTGCGC